MIRRILDKYGITLMLTRGNTSWTLKGFFQPVRSKSWDYSDSNYSPLGEIPRGRYIYIGPVSPAAVAGDIIWVKGREYLVRRSELIRDNTGPVYCWGLCLERGGADEWGRQS